MDPNADNRRAVKFNGVFFDYNLLFPPRLCKVWLFAIRHRLVLEFCSKEVSAESERAGESERGWGRRESRPSPPACCTLLPLSALLGCILSLRVFIRTRLPPCSTFPSRCPHIIPFTLSGVLYYFFLNKGREGGKPSGRL